jgi:hypothetical protein
MGRLGVEYGSSRELQMLRHGDIRDKHTKATRKTDMYMPIMMVMNLRDLGLNLLSPTSLLLLSCTSLGALVGVSSIDLVEDILFDTSNKLHCATL